MVLAAIKSIRGRSLSKRSRKIYVWPCLSLGMITIAVVWLSAPNDPPITSTFSAVDTLVSPPRDSAEASAFYPYNLLVRSRDAATVRDEGDGSCKMDCPHLTTGQALTPPQEPYWFENHSKEKGGGLSQQIHASRAVYEIYKNHLPEMSMQAVDIGAMWGNPEAGPLYYGRLGPKWTGVKLDPASPYNSVKAPVRTIKAKALPSTIAQVLQDACVPSNLDLLKVDIDSYDWDVTKALLDAGLRPKVFAAEIQIPIPPPIHFHLGYEDKFEWRTVSERPKEQQILYGASLSAYSDLFKPLGYSLLTVDYYNVVYVQTKYSYLFKGIPTDDMTAWRTGWFDRPERSRQPDLQKPWLNYYKMEDWMRIENEDERYRVILDHLFRANGAGGTIRQNFQYQAAEIPARPWSVGKNCTSQNAH